MHCREKTPYSESGANLIHTVINQSLSNCWEKIPNLTKNVSNAAGILIRTLSNN